MAGGNGSRAANRAERGTAGGIREGAAGDEDHRKNEGGGVLLPAGEGSVAMGEETCLRVAGNTFGALLFLHFFLLTDPGPVARVGHGAG